jgi:FixJ family two-component response regulator
LASLVQVGNAGGFPMPGLATDTIEMERQEAPAACPHREPDHSWPTVFVVDDDECLRALIGDWVEHAGFRAVPLPGGEACLAALAAQTPLAVVLDLHMVGMGGAATLDAIREAGSDIPVIVLSGDGTPAVQMALIDRGATEFLVKPVRRTDLIRTLLGVSPAPQAAGAH